MKVINERPPIYDAVIASGMRFNPASTLFAYNGAVYNPGGQEIPTHVLAHEAVHLAQHDAYPGGCDAWWGRYLTDPYFRIMQEAEAYATQYAYICGYVTDRNQRSRVMNDLARFLSGPMYGNVISRSFARKLINAELI